MAFLSTPRFLSTIALTVSLFLLAPLSAQASLYLPGATIDPDCPPTDPLSSCGVLSVVASGTANSIPYYATSGSVLSATSTFQILANGTASTTNLIVGNSLTIGALSGLVGVNAGASYAVSTSTLNIGGNAGLVTNGVYTTTFNSLFDPRFITDLSATTSVASITTLANLSILKAQVSDFGTYESPLTFTYPLTRLANAISSAFGTTTTIGVGTSKLLAVDANGILIASSTVSISGSAATVTTNANLTGPITSSGNATAIASQTGTGSTFVMSAGPIITGLTTLGTLSLTAGTSTSFFATTASSTNLFSQAAFLGSLSLGSLSLATTLSVAQGGTGQSSFGQGWLNSDGTTVSASTSPTVNYIVATSTTATSTFAAGIQATYLNLTGTSATSTASNGLNLIAGCFAVNGTCLTSGSSLPSGTIGQTLSYVGTVLTATSSMTLVANGTVSIGSGFSVDRTGAITSTITTGTAPIILASATKVANLNADLLDGFDSSAFGDATAANQTTILTRLGTNTDATTTPSAASSLWAGMKYIAGNMKTNQLAMSAESAATKTHAVGSKYCYDLSAVAEVAMDGNTSTVYTDWRLPTVGEASVFEGTITSTNYIWTATVRDATNYDWIILRLSDGYWYDDNYNISNYVRCLR
jgi:hypothetical protein